MQPLGQVLQEADRYSAKPIVAADPAVADIRVTGTMSERDLPGWLRSLHRALGLLVVDEPHRILLRRSP